MKESQLKFDKERLERDTRRDVYFYTFHKWPLKCCHNIHAVVAVEGNGFLMIEILCVYILCSLHCIISSHTFIFKKEFKKVRAI